MRGSGVFNCLLPPWWCSVLLASSLLSSAWCQSSNTPFTTPLDTPFNTPDLSGDYTKVPEISDEFTNVSNSISAAATIGIVFSCVVALVIVGAVIWFIFILDKKAERGKISFPTIHKKQTPTNNVPTSDISNFAIEVKDRLQSLCYTYAEVLDITKNLTQKLGEGGFGSVYFGELKNGSKVAVKKLSLESSQGTEEFLNEVEILSRVHHKNLVALVGYCCEANERCLIYEFLSKGTLEEHLHGGINEQETLSWLARLRIAVGAAKGFNYLHNDCSPPVIHRDVKCSNILLDRNLTAKVGDFGLSKLLSEAHLTHISTAVKGTFGYLDPEYAQTERLTEKSDVYSFGVILLELLTGKKSIMHHDGEYLHIVHWVIDMSSLGDGRLQSSPYHRPRDSDRQTARRGEARSPGQGLFSMPTCWRHRTHRIPLPDVQRLYFQMLHTRCKV